MLGSKLLRVALFSGTALACAMPAVAWAQTADDPQATTPPANTPTGAATPEKGANVSGSSDDGTGEIIVTGSRIKRDPNESPLPLQIITTQEKAEVKF